MTAAPHEVAPPAAFLRQALENLADAQAALVAGRHNACASRCSYAAFQAAVAASEQPVRHVATHLGPRAGKEADVGPST